MLQSRVISEASFTFVSIREFMVVNRAYFQIQGFIFRLRLYFKWAIPISGFATTTTRANNTRSRCATTWLPTSTSGGYSAAPLPSSPETGLTSHCESDKLSLLSLVRMTLTRNNHCERGFSVLSPGQWEIRLQDHNWTASTTQKPTCAGNKNATFTN